MTYNTIYELKSPTCAELAQMYVDDELAETGTKKRTNILILESKFRMFIHTVLKGQVATYDKETDKLGECYLNARLLEIVFCQEPLKRMLHILISKGILFRTHYQKGVHAYGYRINVNEYPYTTVKIPKDSTDKRYAYDERIRVRLRKHFLQEQEENKQRYADVFCGGDTTFIDQYEHFLSLLEVNSQAYLNNYVEVHECQSKEQSDYYKQISQKLIDKYPRMTFDDRGRVYHRLAYCAKDLRQFLNIDFEVDNHNSQPLLFGLLLVDYYHIAPVLLDVFCAAIDENYSTDNKQPIIFHYEDKEHPFTIKDEEMATNITKEYIEHLNKIPHDVWNYLYAVMKGCLWDMFVTEGIERKVAKENLFKQVFYRNKLKSGFIPGVYGKCGNAFLRQFPNVSKTITSLIRTNEQKWLPNEITRIESEVMRDILKKVWERGFTAITIHDAVVVILPPKKHRNENNLPKSRTKREEIVMSCFMEVFRERHLLCSPAAEVYR